MSQIHLLTAHEITQLFSKGELSAKEITAHTLARIQALNPALNAFLHIFEKRALEKASLLDQKRAKGQKVGALAAVPVAVKENILVKGEIASCGSKFLEHYRAPYDATSVRFLEEEDAILIGQTNMDEFAMGASGIHSAFGPTKNPWNLECSPGGSSSGSAAAVSARLCPLALGSDTGGSIRQPAAFTGIAGFKPSYGRIARYGLVAFASSFDQIGPFARSVQDIALIMETIGKHCSCDSTSIPTPPGTFTSKMGTSMKGMRMGIPWGFLEKLEKEPRDCFEKTINVAKSLGIELVEVNLDVLKYGIAVYYILTSAEASTNLARFDGIRYGHRSKKAKSLEEVYDLSREEGFGFEVKKRIMLGTYVLSGGYKDAYFQKAAKVRTMIIHSLRQAFSQCDLIALPTSPGTSFPLNGIHDPLDEYLQDLYTVAAPIAGLPAISIPNGLSKDQKPFGLQLLGPQMQDGIVLAVASALEQALHFPSTLPAALQTLGGSR